MSPSMLKTRFDDNEGLLAPEAPSAASSRASGRGGVVVRKHDARRPPRGAIAVDQAGMVALIRENDVARFGQRRQHGQIGQIAARKVEGALGALKRGERRFDARESLAIAARAAATPVLRSPRAPRRPCAAFTTGCAARPR